MKKLIWKGPILNEGKKVLVIENWPIAVHEWKQITKQTGNYHNVEWVNITRENVETRLNNKNRIKKKLLGNINWDIFRVLPKLDNRSEKSKPKKKETDDYILRWCRQTVCVK